MFTPDVLAVRLIVQLTAVDWQVPLMEAVPKAPESAFMLFTSAEVIDETVVPDPLQLAGSP